MRHIVLCLCIVLGIRHYNKSTSSTFANAIPIHHAAPHPHTTAHKIQKHTLRRGLFGDELTRTIDPNSAARVGEDEKYPFSYVESEMLAQGGRPSLALPAPPPPPAPVPPAAPIVASIPQTPSVAQPAAIPQVAPIPQTPSMLPPAHSPLNVKTASSDPKGDKQRNDTASAKDGKRNQERNTGTTKPARVSQKMTKKVNKQ